MSKMLTLLNQLKTQASYDLLTDSQQAAFDVIRDALRFPEVVNLNGLPGSGKTFLAWTLSRSLEQPFFPSLTVFDARSKRPTPFAIVDNAGNSERSVRNLLAVAQRKGTHSLLFMTHHPNEMGFFTVTLPLPRTHDFDVIYHNLSLLESYASPLVSTGSFWDAIHSVL